MCMLSCRYGKYFGRGYPHLFALPQTDWYRKLSDTCCNSSKDFSKINVAAAFAPIRYKVNVPKLPIKTSLLGLRIVPKENRKQWLCKRSEAGGGGGGGGGGG